MDLLVPVLFLLSLAAVALLLFRQYRAVRRVAASLDPDHLYQLSVDRYRPMLRLLDEQDLLLLRTQPGFTPDMPVRIRLQRCHIFRQYLVSLNSDFQQVVMLLKILMAQSSEDRPELARVLVRMQILFALGMLMIRLRLILYRWGLAKVHISPLIDMFDFVREKLRVLAPMGQAC